MLPRQTHTYTRTRACLQRTIIAYATRAQNTALERHRHSHINITTETRRTCAMRWRTWSIPNTRTLLSSSLASMPAFSSPASLGVLDATGCGVGGADGRSVCGTSCSSVKGDARAGTGRRESANLARISGNAVKRVYRCGCLAACIRVHAAIMR